jgi:phosphate acyltransferase
VANFCIALDAMGGDYGPSVIVPAAIETLNAFPNINLILVGQTSVLQTHLNLLNIKNHPRLSIHEAPEIVGMDEPPAIALRTKRQSSMRLAIDLVKTGQAQACVSAGNTGERALLHVRSRR